MRLLFILLVLPSICFASINPVSDYYNRLGLLDDASLVQQFVASKNIGACNIRKSPNPGSSCLFRVQTPDYVACIGKLGVYLLWGSDTLLPGSMTKQQFVNANPASFGAISSPANPITVIADFIKNRLIGGSYDCNLSQADIPLQGQIDLGQFTAANTTFYAAANKPNIMRSCKSNQANLTRSFYNPATCQNENRFVQLPLDVCLMIYNRLTKMASDVADLVEIPIVPMTQTEAKEVIESELAQQDNFSGGVDEPLVSFALSHELLQAIQNDDTSQLPAIKGAAQTSSDYQDDISALIDGATTTGLVLEQATASNHTAQLAAYEMARSNGIEQLSGVAPAPLSPCSQAISSTVPEYSFD